MIGAGEICAVAQRPGVDGSFEYAGRSGRRIWVSKKCRSALRKAGMSMGN